jgi:hypothetical protein
MLTDNTAALAQDAPEAIREEGGGTRFKAKMPASLLRRHQRLLHDLVVMAQSRTALTRDVGAQLSAFQSDFDNYAYLAERHLFAYLELHTSEDRAATAAVNAAHALFAASVAHVGAFTSRYADRDSWDDRSFASELGFLRSWLVASLRRIEAVMLGYYRPEAVLAATLRASRPTHVMSALRSA